MNMDLLRAQLMVWPVFIFPVNKTKVFIWHLSCPVGSCFADELSARGLSLQPDCKFLEAKGPCGLFLCMWLSSRLLWDSVKLSRKPISGEGLELISLE